MAFDRKRSRTIASHGIEIEVLTARPSRDDERSDRRAKRAMGRDTASEERRRAPRLDLRCGHCGSRLCRWELDAPRQFGLRIHPRVSEVDAPWEGVEGWERASLQMSDYERRWRFSCVDFTQDEGTRRAKTLKGCGVFSVELLESRVNTLVRQAHRQGERFVRL